MPRQECDFSSRKAGQEINISRQPEANCRQYACDQEASRNESDKASALTSYLEDGIDLNGREQQCRSIGLNPSARGFDMGRLHNPREMDFVVIPHTIFPWRGGILRKHPPRTHTTCISFLFLSSGRNKTACFNTG